MKKRILGLFLAIVTAMSLSCFNVSAESITDYTLEGYNNKQLNNNWAEVTTSDTTDENGVITSTATYSGELGSGKRVASFQPWADYQGTSGSAAGEYTMHFGFTVTEITDMVSLLYQYRNSGGGQTLLYFSDTEVVAGDKLETGNAVSVELPYTVNMFMNIKSGAGYIYVDNQCIFEGNMNASKRGQWREVRVSSVSASNDFKLVTTAANSSLFNDAVTIDQVVDYVINGNDFEVEEPEVEIPDETDNLFYKGVKDMSDYALPGYDNKQINNNWANITLSDSTDAKGVITTTATNSGSLAAGSRVASFQPWEKKKGTYTSAAGAYTMHFGFTVNEINAPLCLAYRFNADKKLISFNDKKVVWGSDINGSRYIEVTAPYTIDIFMNIQNCKGIIFVNGQVLYDGTVKDGSRFYNSSSDTNWTEVRVTNLQEATDIKLVTTKATTSIFNDQVIFEDVVDYVMNKSDAAKTNWLWQIDGMNVGHELMQGAIDGVSSVTGNNTDGYVLQPNSINASHYGFARFFLSTESGKALPTSTEDKVLWQSFEYNPTVLTNRQIFEVRGNNAYQTLITAVPVTETESAYLSIGNSKVAISSDKFYKIDFIVNNKDYEYYILVDGKVAAHDHIWDTRQPLWNTVFSSYTVDEKMTIKNMTTTLYNNSVSVLDVVEAASTSVYTEINDVVYDEEYKELVVTATMAGNAEAYEEAELVYAAYAEDGTLIDVYYIETYSEDINATEFGRAYPYGILDVTDVAEGEKLTVKAFVWNSVEGMKSLSSADTYSYTIPVESTESAE